MQGRSIMQAAIEASRLRLRPILMTSIAFIMGVVPLVMSTRRGVGNAPRDGYRRVLRHARRDAVRADAHAGVLRAAAQARTHTEHITDKHGTHPQMRGIKPSYEAQ